MPRHYTGGEVSVLESFALHAGIAMRNAGNFAQLRQRRLDRAGILSAITASRADGLAALVHQNQEERCFGLTLHSSSGRGDSLLVCLRGPVDDIRMRNLERSAVALSIAKLWTERQIASSTFLRHLALMGQPEAPTIAAARDRLKLGPGQPVQLVLIALPGTDRAARIDTIRHGGRALISWSMRSTTTALPSAPTARWRALSPAWGGRNRAGYRAGSCPTLSPGWRRQATATNTWQRSCR